MTSVTETETDVVVSRNIEMFHAKTSKPAPALTSEES